MFHRVTRTNNAPFPEESQAVSVDLGDFLYVTIAGQMGYIPGSSSSSKKIIDGGVEIQTTQALENIKSIIEKVPGVYGRVDDIVETTIYLQNIDQKERFEHSYEKFFGLYLSPTNKDYRPARDLVEVLNITSNEPTLVQIKARALILKLRK